MTVSAGCQGKRTWQVPDEATPEYQAQQLARSSELVREAQRYELAGNTEVAMEKYLGAIAAYRENPIAWYNLGNIWADQNENMKAAHAFKTASELSPSDPRPLYSLGAIWEQLGYLEDAARWYDEALQRDPNHQNSLRRAILIADLRNRLTPTTADRIKTAILIEQDPWWINRFMRIQQRMLEEQYGPTRPVESGNSGDGMLPNS